MYDHIYPLHNQSTDWESLQLHRHRVILVTGPQRSGTTWVACALATQFGHKLYDERHPITIGNDTLVAIRRAFAYAREQQSGAVIQSPMATSILHELPLFPGLAILFIARNCLDVFRSQNRLFPSKGGWTCTAGRTKELRKYLIREELRPYFDSRDMVCTIKQRVWSQFQRPALERRAAMPSTISATTQFATEPPPPLLATVAFDSFRNHAMFVQERAANLSVKDTAGSCKELIRKNTPSRKNVDSIRWWKSVGDRALRRSGM